MNTHRLLLAALLAVKPQQMREVAQALRPHLGGRLGPTFHLNLDDAVAFDDALHGDPGCAGRSQ